MFLEHIGDRVLNLIEENLINTTSDKQEVMNMCLTSTKGDYQPVSVQISQKTGTTSQNSTPSRQKPVKRGKEIRVHVPGKAGGGWESSEDEAEVQMKQLENLSIKSPESSSHIEMALEVSEDKYVKKLRCF